MHQILFMKSIHKSHYKASPWLLLPMKKISIPTIFCDIMITPRNKNCVCVWHKLQSCIIKPQWINGARNLEVLKCKIWLRFESMMTKLCASVGMLISQFIGISIASTITIKIYLLVIITNLTIIASFLELNIVKLKCSLTLCLNIKKDKFYW